MVGREVLAKDTGVLRPLVDVRRRCFCSVRLAGKFLKSLLHCVFSLLRTAVHATKTYSVSRCTL